MSNAASNIKAFSWEPLGAVLQVEGSAIMPGVFTGTDRIPTEFSERVVAKARAQLLNKPAFAYGHGRGLGDSQTIGFITATDLTDDGKLRVKGYIFDNLAIEDIKAGKFHGMSIEAAAKIKNVDGKDVVQDFDMLRVALVDKPACPTCVIDSIKEVKQMSVAPTTTIPEPATVTAPSTNAATVAPTTPDSTTTVTVVTPPPQPVVPKIESAEKVVEKAVNFSDQLSDPKNIEELLKKFEAGLSKTKIPAAQIELLKGSILLAFSAAGTPESTLDGLWNSTENPWKQKYECQELKGLVTKIKEKDKAFSHEKALEGITGHEAKVAVLTKVFESYSIADTKKVELSAAQPPAKDELKERIDKVSQTLFGKPYGEVIGNLDKGGKK